MASVAEALLGSGVRGGLLVGVVGALALTFESSVYGGDLGLLKNAVFAADANGLKVVIVVSNPGSRTTPLTAQQRSEFTQFCAALAKALPTVRYYTIGNEPNLNGFWLPQFGPDGEDVAAPAYLQLLAAAYDALK